MSARTLFAAGHIPPRTRLARKCSWCSRWMSTEDALRASHGVEITHTICPDCEGRVNAEIDETEPWIREAT